MSMRAASWRLLIPRASRIARTHPRAGRSANAEMSWSWKRASSPLLASALQDRSTADECRRRAVRAAGDGIRRRGPDRADRR